MKFNALYEISRAAFVAIFALCGLASCGGGDNERQAGADQSPAPRAFSISGTVSGLEGRNVQLVLASNDTQELIVGDGAFRFSRSVPQGERVALAYAPPDGFECQMDPRGESNHPRAWFSFSLQSDTSISIECRPTYSLFLRVTGASPERPDVITPNTPMGGRARSAMIDYEGRGFHILVDENLLEGDTYNVYSQSGNCQVIDGIGVMPAQDVTLEADCSIRSVSYRVEGLSGTGLQVALSRDSQQFETRSHDGNGQYTFDARLYQGEEYEVSVTRQPVGPDQYCEVENPVGVIGATDVTEVVVRCPSLLRTWRFDWTPTLFTAEPYAGDSQETGIVDVRYDFPENPSNKALGHLLGLSGLGLDIYDELFDLPGTNMAVYSNETGKTYWVAAEAGEGPAERTRATTLETTWWLRKTSEDARVVLQITDVWLDAVVDYAGRGFWADPSKRYLISAADVVVQAFRILDNSTEPMSTPFYSAADIVQLKATPGTLPGVLVGGLLEERAAVIWELDVLGGTGSAEAIFSEDMFWISAPQDFPVEQGMAKVHLNDPVNVVIDLSHLGDGQRVMLKMGAAVRVENAYNRESHAIAYFRDPAQFDPEDPQGGMTITEMTGVEIIEPGTIPEGFTPTQGGPAPACTDPSAARSQLQFGEAEYAIFEDDSVNRVVTVTRTGSSAGEVSAWVRLAPGTATEGTDYLPGDFLVRFPDGVTTPRSIVIPVNDDTSVESAETILLTLTDVSGCADAGPIPSATVTLVDDETQSAPTLATYSIGGTVTGLAGSGLVIETLSDQLPIAANGPFEFAREFPTGYIYRVVVATQPQNPRQACTVTGGEGGVGNADITGIEIQCVTLPDSGAVDPAFGTSGRAWGSDLGAIWYDTALARQLDGKLLMVAGNDRLTRYLPDGAPDTAFGVAGTLTVTSGQSGSGYNLEAVAVQPDGRILVTGNAPNGVSGRADILVARYEASGVLDTTFAGGAGIATFDYGTWNDSGSDLVLLADGSILVVGRISDASGSGATDFAVLKLTSGGQIDTNYGSGGWARVNVAGGYDVPWSGALTADGGLVLVGRVASSGGSNADIGIAKFTSAGLPDPTFGTAGNGTIRPITATHEEARDVTVLADGSFLVVGLQQTGSRDAIWLARYFANGLLDTSFGDQGVATTPADMHGTALAVKADGNILVAGELLASGATQTDFGVARFTATGQLDASFGNDGVLPLDMHGGFDVPGAMLLQPDGYLVVAGQAYNGANLGRGLVRVLP